MEHEKKSSAAAFTFDGHFTAAIRRQIRFKRHELGLPYQRIANFFGINWSTFRKWEIGPTETCEICYRPRLESFLKGDYDVHLRQLAQSRDNRNYDPLIPQEVLMCLERVTNAYRLCHERQDLRNRIVEDINQATTNAMSRLISMPRT